MNNLNFDKLFIEKSIIMNIQYSENSINSSKLIQNVVKCHARNMIQIK